MLGCENMITLKGEFFDKWLEFWVHKFECKYKVTNAFGKVYWYLWQVFSGKVDGAVFSGFGGRFTKGEWS